MRAPGARRGSTSCTSANGATTLISKTRRSASPAISVVPLRPRLRDHVEGDEQQQHRIEARDEQDAPDQILDFGVVRAPLVEELVQLLRMRAQIAGAEQERGRPAGDPDL